VFVVDRPALVASAFTPRPILCDNYAVAGHDDRGAKAVTVKGTLPAGLIFVGRVGRPRHHRDLIDRDCPPPSFDAPCSIDQIATGDSRWVFH
jgi:hypothetical protein